MNQLVSTVAYVIFLVMMERVDSGKEFQNWTTHPNKSYADFWKLNFENVYS